MDNLPNDLELRELAELERELAAPVRGVAFGGRKPDTDRVWARVVTNPTRSSAGFKNWGRWVAGVGALAFMLPIGFIAVRNLSALRPVPKVKTYSTVPTQRATITLADGSTVILAPATTLKVSNRSVELNGEALFTVPSHKDSPFTVTVNGMTTRVLGTTFSVRKYNDDKFVRVVVAEGKVAFLNTVISTGDVAVASNNGNIQVSHDMPLTSMLDWASGRLIFNRTPLGDAIPDLQRWYGVSIRVTDVQLLQRRMTASFQLENIHEAAHAIAIALGARAEVNGNTVIFSKGEI